MRAVAIARVTLSRYFRDRQAILVVFVLPFLIVLLLGASSGGAATPKVGFFAEAPDALTARLLEGLRAVEGVDITEADDADEVIRAVERGSMQAAVLVPEGYEARLRAGDDVEVRFVKRAEQQLQGLTGVLQAVVTQQATLLRTARFASAEGYGTFGEALSTAEQLQAELPPVQVVTTTAGEPFALANLGQFDIFAQNMLVLFIFMAALGGAVNLVQARNWGVTQRMYSTPTTVRDIIAGEALGRFTIALIQGFVVFLGTWLMFGVEWGDPVGAVATILVFSLVASGAAMLLGALASTEQQANGLATTLGLALAALGGAMFPLAVLELISDVVYRVAHVTPHAWALEAFLELVSADGGLGDIALFLLILLGYALVFYALAVWRLRRVLVR